jgi:hypothetical protein
MFSLLLSASLSFVLASQPTLYGEEPEQEAQSAPSSGVKEASTGTVPSDDVDGQDEQTPPEAPRTADEGIAVKVEQSTDRAGGAVAAEDIKIYSPYPAKPLAAAPQGWNYVPAPETIKPYKQTVNLGSGSTVDLSITPFILVPSSDGVKTFTIREPGYDPSMQFSQQHTIGAMLQASTMEIEEHEKMAAKVITRLQQLLSSLPRK